MKINGMRIREHHGHKYLSSDKVIAHFEAPQFVYLPLEECGCVCECFVKPGDHVLLGEVVARRGGRFASPIHASVSGTVREVGKKVWHASGSPVPTLVIENDFQDTPAPGVFAEQEPPLTREAVIERVEAAGVIGLGGAGFPTYVKYKTPAPISTLIVNAAECEPYLTVDYALILSEAPRLVAGIKLAMLATGAARAVIAIKKDKKKAIAALTEAIAEEPAISLHLLKDIYPAGWEKYIVQHVMHKTYQTLPAEVGAVVNNVGTLLAVEAACRWNEPLYRKVVTFSGKGLANPQNVMVRIGTLANEVVAAIGGYADCADDCLFVAGAPMTGKTVAFDELTIHRCLSGVIVMPRPAAVEYACLGCGHCVNACPVGLAPLYINQAVLAKNIEEQLALAANKCIECGLCSYVCPSRIDLTKAMGQAKANIKKQGR